MLYEEDSEIDSILLDIEEVLEKRINPDDPEIINDLKFDFYEEIMRSIRRVVGYHRESQRLPYEKME